MKSRTKILLVLVPLLVLVALSFLLKFLHSQLPTTGQQLIAAAEGRLPLREKAIPLFDYTPLSPPPTLASVNLPDLITAFGIDYEIQMPSQHRNMWYLHSQTLIGNWQSPPFKPAKPEYARLITRVLEKEHYFDPEKFLAEAQARASARPAHTQFKNWLTADTALLQRATSTENALDLLVLLSEKTPLGPVLTFTRDNLTWYCWAKPDDYTDNKSLYCLVAFAPDGAKSFEATWSFKNAPPEPDPSLTPAQAWLIAGLIHQSRLTQNNPAPPPAK